MSQERRKELGKALMEALEHDAEARCAYLDELRQREPGLAEELEGMLAFESDMETDFMAVSAAEEIGAPEPTWRQPLSDCDLQDSDLRDSEPRIIGPYRLLEILGTGGMGEVYLAEQKEPLERTVALKLVRSTFRDQAARARFEAERTMLERLEHPNIGRILDAGFTDDGFPFFALEVIQGEPLDRYCNQRELSIRQRLELMIVVCRGVGHAHRRRIIHRDLKPSNILVCEIDGAAVPKIIDFGIAESLDRPAQASEQAMAYGTPAYMSPEALLGSVDVDTRTDVYSLGILLYQLLVGFRPFDAESFDELVDQVSSQDPPAPSTRLSTGVDKETAERIAEQRQSSRLELKRKLRGDLSWILLKAVAKEADQRYDSAAALADDLERHLQNRPIFARPWSAGYRLGKWLARHRWPAAAAALMVVAAVGLVGQDLHSRARTERLTRAGQELTRQIERVEWRLRVAHLLPHQDLTAELASIRHGMGELRSRAPELYSGNRGMADYALGRGALSLGELHTARKHLESAWQAGYQRPEAALALGTTLGRLYERKLDAASRVPGRTTRQALRRRAESELRDPALKMLGEAESDLTMPELLMARVAFYRGELDRALEQSRVASRRGPAFFEARFLEAQILGRQAMAAGLEKADALELLRRAESAAQGGLDIARSSPEGHLRLCQIRGSRINYLARYGQEGVDDAASSCLAACAQAKEVLPAMVEADLVSAAALINLVEVKVWDRHEDPAATLTRLAATLTELRALRSDSVDQRAEAERLLGAGENLRSIYLEQQGHDPRPALDATIEHFRLALRLGGDLHQVHSDLAQVFAHRGNFGMNRGQDPTPDLEEAEIHARAAVDLAPESPVSLTYLAHVYLRRAEYQFKVGKDPSSMLDAADIALERSLELDPDRVAPLTASTVAFFLRGRWQLKSGVDPQASFRRVLSSATRTLELFPDSAYAFLMGGQGWLELARLEMLASRDPSALAAKSREWHQRGIEKAPGLSGAYAQLADLELIAAAYAMSSGGSPVSFAEQARSHAEQALEIDAQRNDAVRLRGEAELVLAFYAASIGEPAERLFERSRASLEQARRAEPDIAATQTAAARWVWRKAQAGLEVASAERDMGLAAAREARPLDGRAMEALALEGALLSLGTETRAEGLAKIAEAVAANSNLAQEWHDLTAGE